MVMTLAEVGEHLGAKDMPKDLRAILAVARQIFSYGEERNNRVVRFVAIVNAYRHGERVRDIESEYGCSTYTVMRYARLAGLPKRPKHLPAEIRAAIIRDYKAGMTVAAIALAHSVSQGYVSKTAREEKISRYRTYPAGADRSRGRGRKGCKTRPRAGAPAGREPC